LARGERLTELLKQGQYAPLPVEEQVVSIFAGVRGYLDKINVSDITRFEQGLLLEIKANGVELLAKIRDEQELSESTDKELASFVEAYTNKFV
jgi:F-type H+-transporting ATPase subunit alpha